MTMPYYASAEQLMRDRSEYARKGISRGRSVAVLTYADGVLFIAENPSSTLHKVGEIYDRIGFAAVGRYSEFESLRVAGVRLADVRGYSYNRRDVTGRIIANAYAQTLGEIFTQQTKPFEVELCVAEVGDTPEADQLYRLTFDGSIVDEPDFVVMGGQAEAVRHLREHSAPAWAWPTPSGRRPRAVRGQPGHRRRQRRRADAGRRAARGGRPRPQPAQARLPPGGRRRPARPARRQATRSRGRQPRTRPAPQPGTPPGLATRRPTRGGTSGGAQAAGSDRSAAGGPALSTPTATPRVRRRAVGGDGTADRLARRRRSRIGTCPVSTFARRPGALRSPSATLVVARPPHIHAGSGRWTTRGDRVGREGCEPRPSVGDRRAADVAADGSVPCA